MSLWRRKRDRPIPGADDAIGWLKAPAPAHPRVPGPAPVPGQRAPSAEPRTPARPAPAPGQDRDCSLCGFYRVFDATRGHWVHRYEKCPAHQKASHAQE